MRSEIFGDQILEEIEKNGKIGKCRENIFNQEGEGDIGKPEGV